MKAHLHPEYDSERTKLEETIELIQRELDAIELPVSAYGADQRGAAAVRQMKLKRLEKLKQARKDLYFGRVDWKAASQDLPETFYLGKVELSLRKVGLPDIQIYNWRKTTPAMIYYEGQCEEKGKRLLRRTYDIKADQLNSIIDEDVAAERAKVMGLTLPSVVVEPAVHGDQLLIQLLEQTRGGRLHDIVATIQQEQFQLIRSPLNQILVIQGVAGSGKTAIALHRIAYLLYQHESKGELSRQRMLYLGPNPIFLNYVARVLPELGERGVPQMAFDEWLLRLLDMQADYEPEELALETLLDPDLPLATRIMRYRNARNKGSLKIARLLDRYVDYLVEQIITDLGDFSFVYQLSSHWVQRMGKESISCTITQTQLRDLVHEVRTERNNTVPLNRLKPRVATLLSQTAYRLLNAEVTQNTAREHDDLLKRIREQLEREIENHLRPWESLNVSVAYRGLLRSPDLLRRLGETLFNRWELELLHFDAPKQGTPFRFSDLGALLYLHLLLEGIDSEKTFEHVVIDEAQDITPLQFLVLKRWSRNQSMTLMGDLAQGIYSDHGLRRWDELNEVFQPTPIELRMVQQSYRSTQQIIEYANDMLRRAGEPEEHLAQPIARSGPPPVERNFVDSAERVAAIHDLLVHDLLVQEQAQGPQSIAIILKTAKGCRQLAAELKSAGVTGLQLIDSRTINYEGRLAILPIYLAKGLEFDTVIVADADATTYPALSLEARLLYVALTRASHRLHVGWIGQPSPLLDKSQQTIQLLDFFEQQLAPDLVTIEEFAQSRQPTLDPDFCVERLASASKLHLLDNGLVDRTTLEVLATEWNPRTSNEESAPELDPQVQNAIRLQVSHLTNGSQPADPDALALLQLSFGLLRGVMRTIGIVLADDQEDDLREQAVALARFLNAIRTEQITYSVGQPTTERRVLQAVIKEWQPLAQKQLHLLLDHGIVETFTQTQGVRIRIPYEWIESILLAGLGHAVERWDADLQMQLPHLPASISQQIVVSDMKQTARRTGVIERMKG